LTERLNFDLVADREKVAKAFGIDRNYLDLSVTSGIDHEFNRLLDITARVLDAENDHKKLTADSFVYNPTRSPSELVNEAAKGQSDRYRQDLTKQVNEALLEEYALLRKEAQNLFADKSVADTMKKLQDYARQNKWTQDKLRAVQETLVGRMIEQRIAMSTGVGTGAAGVAIPATEAASGPQASADELAASQLADEVMLAFQMPVTSLNTTKSGDSSNLSFPSLRKRGVETIAPLLNKFAEVAFNAKTSRNSQLQYARTKLNVRRTESDNVKHVQSIIAKKDMYGLKFQAPFLFLALVLMVCAF